MPKFIGNDLKCVETWADNCEVSSRDVWVRVAYSQAAKLDAADRAKSLDTTDSGSRGSYAKRWFRWFGRRDAVRALGTASALRRAGVAR
jgi:hypothetical protein